MKIAIITDSWIPLINGVTTTLSNVVDCLEDDGHNIFVIHPGMFKNFPCPTYPEIRLTRNPWSIKKFLNQFNPEAIHIATEGPLGYFGRKWCLKNKKKFTTSYHTKFPEYLHMRTKWPLSFSYNFLKNFHNQSNGTLITTDSMKHELEEKGFENLTIWTRGVDQNLFNPNKRTKKSVIPTYLYVGRISVEKNIETFLNIETFGKKVVVGDGPQLKELKQKYKTVEFVGAKQGIELAEYYANADVFVFPSKSDTFGVVMIEALASGLPIAAYPVTGPIDIVKNGYNGILSDDLKYALDFCLYVSKNDCRESVKDYTWKKCAEIFFNHLVPN